MAKPSKITEPEKELRFTRARQALTFVAGGGGFVCATLLIWVCGPLISGRTGNDVSIVASLFGCCLMLSLSSVCFWVAVNCARHAVIILTPLSIELFPFWFPKKNLQVIYWSEIVNALVTEDMKMMEIECRGGRKVFVALAPITGNLRLLLKHAIDGRMARGIGHEDN